MDLICEGIAKAFTLLVTLDAEVLGITWLSLKISGSATLISLLIGMTTGTAIALAHFPGKRIAISLINTGMGLPPVVVGLFVSILLWRNGPLGFLEIQSRSQLFLRNRRTCRSNRSCRQCTNSCNCHNR